MTQFQIPAAELAQLDMTLDLLAAAGVDVSSYAA